MDEPPNTERGAHAALRERLRIYLVVDATGRPFQDLVESSGRLLEAGVTALQYRDKSAAGPAERARRAGQLGQLAARHRALFIVNDNPQLAMDVGADGVHLGPRDAAVRVVRQQFGSALLIGRSVGDPTTARAAEEEGADYLGVGAIYDARATKADASSPRGVPALRSVVASVRVPVVAIGGISAANAPCLFEAGAAGLAMVRGLLDADDPVAAVKAVLDAAKTAGATPT